MYQNEQSNIWSCITIIQEQWDKLQSCSKKFCEDIGFIKNYFELNKDDLKCLEALEHSYYQNITSHFHLNIGNARDEIDALIKINTILSQMITLYLEYTRLFHRLLLKGSVKRTSDSKFPTFK